MFSPGWAVEVVHVLLSSYLATAAAMAAIHAAFLLRAPHSRFHRAALGIAMMFAVPAALLQPLSGDFSARSVAVRQPAKLAALEGQFQTERGAPAAPRRLAGSGGADDALRAGDPPRAVVPGLSRSRRGGAGARFVSASTTGPKRAWCTSPSR